MRQLASHKEGLLNLHFEKHEFEAWLVRNRNATYDSSETLCGTCAMARFLQEELREPTIHVGFATATRNNFHDTTVWLLPQWVAPFTAKFGSDVKTGEEALRIFFETVKPDIPFSLLGALL